MTTGKTLVDKARILGFSDSYVAERLGINRSYLSLVRTGRAPMSPEVAAMLAAICGDDATEALVAQTIENEKNPDRKERLRRVLFKGATRGERSSVADMTLYTLSRLYIALRIALRAARPDPFGASGPACAGLHQG